MTDDGMILVLLPVTPGEGCGIPGSTQIEAGCGHTCWISPSGMGTLLGISTRTICMRCLPKHDPAPYARDELIRTLGPVMAEKLIAAAQKHVEGGGTLP